MKLRIGTRESELATWQAGLVKDMLAEHGVESELIFITTQGDADLTTPLYELGVQGVFTKSLDIALLNDQIDLAVHSMKDVPTTYAKGLIKTAVLPRANFKDLFVPRSVEPGENEETFFSEHPIVATSSVRRMAQWIHRYPTHSITDIRGNVNTRLKKLNESNWDGAIFAAAGLERINKRPANAIELDWMLPAPAQGAIMVMSRQNDTAVYETAHQLNDADSELCTAIEKTILHYLKGGCSMPVSALAELNGDEVFVVASLLSVDGRKKIGTQKLVSKKDAPGIGKIIAKEILENGGQEILDEIEADRK